MGATSFEFVIQDGNKGFPMVTQTRIRRQAMRAVAATRRRTGRYGKHNLRQPEISYTSTETELFPTAVPLEECGRYNDNGVVVHKERSRAGGPAEGHWPNPGMSIADPATDGTLTAAVAAALDTFSPSIFLSDVQLFMKGYSVQPEDLSALTSIRLPPLASATLTTRPGKLRDFLSGRQWSYFEYLYSRYGQSKCLDDATRCLVMAAEHLLAPSLRTSSGAILAQYGAALESLRKAVNDPDGCVQSNTLCAVNMLQLFSVLYPAACPAQTWSQHIAGCMRMMQLKGPHDFKTDYEKAVLIAMGGTLTTETFYQNQACFLEEPEWQDAILACKVETDFFSDRSPLAIELGALIVRLPGACKRVGDVVCSDNPSAEAIEGVRHEVRQLREQLRLWRIRFDTELSLDLPLSGAAASQRHKRLDALANEFILDVLLARLLGSVQVSERFLLEDVIQQHGAYILETRGDCIRHDFRAAFYMTQKYAVAVSVIETSHLWRAPCLSGELIEAWKFRQWCDAVPRRTPSG